MALNYIYPFAQSGGALVLDTASYNADAQRINGNQPGVARANFVNKAMKQASAIAAGIAQFLADNQVTDVTDDLLAAAISTMMTTAVKAAASSPPGTIVWVPGTTPLANTVKLNGSLLSRTTYSRLLAFATASGNMAASDGAWVSGQFSPGDGSTTFRIPDLRGYTVRAWDDARGINSGRAIGTVEGDQLLAHSHGVTDPSHNHTVNDPSHAHGVSDPSHAHNYAGSTAGINTGVAPFTGQNTSTGGTQTTTNSGTGIGIQGSGTGIFLSAGLTGISIQTSSGGSEVRVKNIALMPVIYF